MFANNVYNLFMVGFIIQVVWEKKTGEFLRFSSIMKQLLFDPCGMSEAAFWLDDGDARVARIPVLYGAPVLEVTKNDEICIENDEIDRLNGESCRMVLRLSCPRLSASRLLRAPRRSSTARRTPSAPASMTPVIRVPS